MASPFFRIITVPASYHRRTIAVYPLVHVRISLAKSEDEAALVRRWYGVGAKQILRRGERRDGLNWSQNPFNQSIEGYSMMRPRDGGLGSDVACRVANKWCRITPRKNPHRMEMKSALQPGRTGGHSLRSAPPLPRSGCPIPPMDRNRVCASMILNFANDSTLLACTGLVATWRAASRIERCRAANRRHCAVYARFRRGLLLGGNIKEPKTH